MTSGGIQLLPLFLGKLVGSYVELMFFAFAYAAGYYSFVGSQAIFAQYWFMFLALHFAITGMSNLIAVLFEVSEYCLRLVIKPEFIVSIVESKQSSQAKPSD